MKGGIQNMVKNYVLDTNLLMDNPNIIFDFEDNNVYITGTTLQELDHHKNDRGEIGYNVREVSRIITKLQDECEDITTGMNLPNGGKLFLIVGGISQENLPDDFSLSIPDNRIISACIELKKNNPNTILLSNDMFLRITASACGLESQYVIKDRVENTEYTGHRVIEIEDGKAFENLYKDKVLSRGEITPYMREDEPDFIENEFVTLQYEEQSELTVYHEHVIDLIRNDNLLFKNIYGNIKPRNNMQEYALWALLNPDIDLVILKGPAGTAKTFLSLAAGLTQFNAGLYNSIMLSRPNVEGSDPGFGFLPGELEEKMAPLIASYRDNLMALCRMQYKNKEKIDITDTVNEMFEKCDIELCPLNYIRGRTLDHTYLICDEAQNANAKLIKAVVTRAGKGTKIIIAGDPDQCDAPNIDKHNNGLVYVSEMMKGAKNTAIIQFNELQCERSNLAKIAINRMK